MRPNRTSHEFQPSLDERTYEAPVLTEIGGVYELTLWGGGGDDGDDGGGGHHHTWPCWHGKTIGRSDGFTWIITLPIASC
jgi:hypothetical protein